MKPISAVMAAATNNNQHNGARPPAPRRPLAPARTLLFARLCPSSPSRSHSRAERRVTESRKRRLIRDSFYRRALANYCHATTADFIHLITRALKRETGSFTGRRRKCVWNE
ncbi:hypothetical protein EVAR_82535_1 [Eumeta japonica]|uniref:Uncharacterized protein n=1 Tax=Eumeta variegata TaxID=151549 RepID=A0A4C1UWC6_EUMVA|nr:hypothetical protein EVAR_82535_1 [Eumeta japonica]